MTEFYSQDPLESPSGVRNFALSLSLHALIFVFSSFLPNPLVPINEGTIEIEYINSGPLNQGVQTRVAKPVAKSVVTKPSAPEIIEPEPVAEPELKVDDLALPVASQNVEENIEESFIENENIAEIETPDLATTQLETPDISDAALANIDSEIESADMQLEQELAAEEKALAIESAKAASLQKKLLAQQKASMEALAKARAAKAAKQAAARAKEEALRAAALRKQQAAAAASARAKKAALERGKVAKSGAAAAFGIPNGVKELKDFRQYPGNPRPTYSAQDRYQKKQGLVIFLAFVTKSGNLVNFKLKKSSKFRSLDIRTLQALKKWKFHPGQEGWVELPFKWNLEGDAQEYPSGLRRKLGQN